MRTSGAVAALAVAGVACVSAPFTGGGPADAGSDAEVDAGPTFCTGQTDALFCADFDRGDDVNFGFEHTEETRGAQLAVSTDPVVSAPGALLAFGPAASKAAANAKVNGQFQRVSLKFAIRLDDLAVRLRDQGGTGIASLSFENEGVAYAASFVIENDQITLVETPGDRRASAPATIVTDTWFDVEIEGTLPTGGSSSAPLKITVRGAGDQVFSKELTWSPPATHTFVKVEVGVYIKTQPLVPANYAVRYDNVVLTGTRVP